MTLLKYFSSRTIARGLGLSAIAIAGLGTSEAIANPMDWINPIGELLMQSSSTRSTEAIAAETESPTAETEPTASEPAEPQAAEPVTQATRFGCQVVDGEYTVVYYPQSQPGEAYPWAKPTELGGGWTPERRCNEISRRLESYRPDGLLELSTGLENGYDTVCVTTEADSSCRIVLTVPPGQNPELVRDRVFENLAVADSGQRTDAVTTFTTEDSDVLNTVGELLGIDLSNPSTPATIAPSTGIDLRPFLDPADGGTGTQLLDSVPAEQRLNPDNFR